MLASLSCWGLSGLLGGLPAAPGLLPKLPGRVEPTRRPSPLSQPRLLCSLGVWILAPHFSCPGRRQSKQQASRGMGARDSFLLGFDLSQDWKGRKKPHKSPAWKPPLTSLPLREASPLQAPGTASLAAVCLPLSFLGSLYYVKLPQLLPSLLFLLLFSLCLFITL